MRAPLGSRSALLGDLGISLGAALGGRQRRSRIDMRGRGRWPSAGATLDLDFVNQQGYAYGQGIGRIQDLVTISGGAGGTVVGPSGLIVPTSAPRFDYDPVSLACRGLLIEGQRTNLAPYSDVGEGWLSGGTTPPTVTNGVSYLGESCVKIDFTPAMGSGYSGCRATRNTAGYAVVLNLGTAYSYAAHVSLSRPLTSGEEIVLYVTGSWGFGAIGFTPGSSGQYVGKFVRSSYNNTTGAVVGVGGTDYFTLYKNTLNADLSVYLTKLQIEAGTFVTSHIPTGAAAVTRTVDTALISGANFTNLYGSCGGYTLLLGFVKGVAANVAAGGLLELAQAGVTSVQVGTNSDGSIFARMRDASNIRAVNFLAAQGGRVAASFDPALGDITAALNGAMGEPAGSPAPGLAPVSIRFGFNGTNGTALLTWLTRAQLFPRMFNATELQELTR